MSKILSIQNVGKRFGFTHALNGVGFSLEAGRVAGLMGPNGAGKTTLLNILAGQIPPDEGDVQICGQPLSVHTRAFTSYVPDRTILFDWMKVKDALAYYKDMFADFDSDRADKLCEILQIEKKARIKQLSFGTRERVLVMLAFARKANLYLLDEPFTGIDPLGKDRIIKAILAGVTEESTVIISTHQVKEIETILDEVIFLDHGQVKLFQSAESIRAERGMSIEACYLQEFSHE